MRLVRTFTCVVVPMTLCFGALHSRTLRAQDAGKITRFDVAALDRSADACTNFYQFACGGWKKNNPIPADQSSWGRLSELNERNRETLRGLLDTASKDAPGRPALQQKIGDYYGACMDETAIERLEAKPLEPGLQRIAGLKTKEDVAAEAGRLHRIGVGVFFGFGAEQDFKDATTVMAIADQGGMGLPDRDFYFQEDVKSVERRKAYVDHIRKMFVLAGTPAAKAEADAKAVMTFETALAKAALSREARRDPNKIYNKLTRDQLLKLTPAFAWTQYLAGLESPDFSNINVTEPEFFKSVNGLISSTSLDDLKTYLRWHVIHEAAPRLSTPFVNENFEFYGKTLTGRKELRARWKRCVDYVDEDLGDALGQMYVEATFGAEGKAQMIRLVSNLERALQQDITADLPWMSPETKARALKKLSTFRKKIGYPDRWRDYSTLNIVRGDFYGDSVRATEFETKRQLAKMGKPVDKDEWLMSAPTVNAYYNPLMNEIVFPAGILQPPFFDRTMDDAVNYGAIGAVIGHEITHGFDDQGRQFDELGNLNDWWTEKDNTEFTKRADCFVQQYGGYTAVEDLKLNGKLTLGENGADNGGVRIALMALVESLAGKTSAPVDGFTPEQRFFLGWGQVWCENVRPEAARMEVTMDPHSPGEWRVNGVVSNMPEFAKAFSCKADAPMVKQTQCRIW